MIKKTLSLIAALMATACTQASLAVVNFPSHFADNQVTTDIAYGSDPLQKMDIYVPSAGKDHKHDVIVFIYGGRWTFGSKDYYKFVGTTLANNGFIAVIPDYRKYPQVHFPVFVEDTAKALAWVYDHIDSYGGKADHIYVMGHSAGAHMGALLATDAHYLAAEGKQTQTVMRGFIGLAGPYAFTPDEPDLEDMFGPPPPIIPTCWSPLLLTGNSRRCF